MREYFSAATRERLLASIDKALHARSGNALGFEPEIEQLYDTDNRTERAQQLRLAILVGMVVFDACVLGDGRLAPDSFNVNLMMRLGLITPLALLCLKLVGTTHRAIWELGTFAVLSAAVSTTLVAFSLSHAPLAPYLVSVVPVLVMFANVAVPLRFPWALGFTAFSCAAVNLSVWLHPDVVADLALYLVALCVLTSVFTLVSNYMREKSVRHGYLLTLRESLRSEILTHDKSKLETLSNTDPLTGVANRRYFDAALSQVSRHAAEACAFYALILIDVDHFKLFNDKFGHPRGDDCLKRVAQAMQGRMRHQQDLLARYGGEEFAVMCPATSTEEAVQLALELLEAVREMAIPHDGQDGRRIVTISIGVAVANPARTETLADLYARADAALYDAKRLGRNRVHLSSDADRRKPSETASASQQPPQPPQPPVVEDPSVLQRRLHNQRVINALR